MAELSLFVPATLRSIAAAKSDADYYAISLDMIRYATPLDVDFLADSPAVPAGVFKNWLAGFRGSVMRHNAKPAGYRHTRISDGVSLLTAGGSPADKVLLIGLCGRTHDLCAPTALILQYFPEAGYDLLVLRDVRRVGFTQGIFGYAESVAAVAKRLPADVALGAYREVRCFGVSSGGAPALLLGTLLDARRVLAICGRRPTESPEYGKSKPARDLEQALEAAPVDPQRAAAVHAVGHRVDTADARALARLSGAAVFTVPDLVDHNIIEPLHRFGRLREFLRSVGLLT